MVVYSIGHSNHSLAHLVELLVSNNIKVVLDVRSRPYSRFARQFDRANLEGKLKEQSIEYIFLGDSLGGRPGGIVIPVTERSLAYERFARSGGFQRGLEKLLDTCQRTDTAIMCAEENPTHCHRRLLIAKVLIDKGVEPASILHIRGNGTIQTEERLSMIEQFETQLPLV